MKLETSEGEREEAQRWYNKDAFFVRAARALRAPIPAPLLPTEDQVARGVAAIEREWPASVSEPYPGTPAVTLRHGEKPVEMDDLVRTVLAAAAPPTPPLPAEVEEMRKVLLAWAGDYNLQDESCLPDDLRSAASLLSRWPGVWRDRRKEMPPPECKLFLAAWLDTGEIECVELLNNYQRGDTKAWMNQNSANFIADSWSLWMPLPAPGAAP